MTQMKKFSLFVMVIGFSALGCGLLQPPTITPTQLEISTLIPTLEPTATSTETNTPIPLSTPTTPAMLPPTQSPEDTSLFQPVTSIPDLHLDTYEDVHVRALADGSVWIISNRRVMRWDGLTWQDILSEDEDMLSAVDDGGRLWVLSPDATNVAAWQDGKWTIYGADRGWTSTSTAEEMSWWSPATWNAIIDAAGSVWLPMTRDVRLFDGNRWSIHTLENMDFPSPYMEDLGIIHLLAIPAGGKEMWVGECYYSGPGPMGGGGARWFDGVTWQGVDTPVDSTCVSAVEVDTAGNVWLGAYQDIWRYGNADQTWTSTSLPVAMLKDYNFAYPLQLLVDQAGDAWMIMHLCGGASCSGPAHLYRIHEGEWSLIIDSPDSFTPLKQLAMDGSGQVWLFWDGEVFQLEEETLSQVTSMAARGVDVSPDGKVWAVAINEEGADLVVMEP